MAVVSTILGIFLAIPRMLAADLVAGVGSRIAYLAIGDHLVSRDEDWQQPFLLGAVINGGLALSGVGGIDSFYIGAIGFGTAFRDL